MRIHSLRFTTALLVGGALALTGCSGSNPSLGQGTQQSDAPGQGGSSQGGSDTGATTPGDTASGDGTPRDTDLAGATFKLSWLDALDAAAERFDGEPVSLSLEWQRTAFAYGVELVSDTESYEVVINADTGEVMHEETEPESAADVAEKRRGIIKSGELIEPAKAMEAAVAAVAGSVSEWEIDDEDGRMSYEVQILTDPGDTDVRVDAVSGEIIEIDS